MIHSLLLIAKSSDRIPLRLTLKLTMAGREKDFGKTMQIAKRISLREILPERLSKEKNKNYAKNLKKMLMFLALMIFKGIPIQEDTTLCHQRGSSEHPRHLYDAIEM